MQLNEDFNDDDIKVDEVMKHFDNSISQHYNDDENSNKSISNIGTPNKSIESENNTDNTISLSARSISRQNSQEQRADKVLNIFNMNVHLYIMLL